MAHWQRIFPQNVITFFCRCNSVRIGQNIQNEVSLERYIFADAVAYQFINLNSKLNSPGWNVYIKPTCSRTLVGGEGAATRSLVYIVPYGSYTNLAVRKWLAYNRPLTNNTELCWPNYTCSAHFSDGLVVINQRGWGMTM